MAFPADIGVELVCPQCRTHVVREGDGFVCCAADCRLRYPILDEIPKFLIEDAVALSSSDWSRLMSVHGRDAVTGESTAVSCN